MYDDNDDELEEVLLEPIQDQQASQVETVEEQHGLATQSEIATSLDL